MYKCKLCGERASSKCVRQRSIFPEDQTAAVLTYFIKQLKYEPHHDGESGDVTLLFRGRKGTTESEVVMSAFRLIREMSEETLMHYACDHVWVAQDTCNFGCCKKGDEVPE